MALNLRERMAGRNWALIIGTVFFVVDTLVMADAFARPVAIGSRVLVTVIWLIGVAAAVLLWLRASPGFFSRQPSYPAGDQDSPGGGDAIAR